MLLRTSQNLFVFPFAIVWIYCRVTFIFSPLLFYLSQGNQLILCIANILSVGIPSYCLLCNTTCTRVILFSLRIKYKYPRVTLLLSALVLELSQVNLYIMFSKSSSPRVTFLIFILQHYLSPGQSTFLC